VETTTRRGSFDQYLEIMASRQSPGSLRFYLNRLFEDIDLDGKSVLEVGAGDGTLSFYAACAGAARVVSLEPEAQGSRAKSSEVFARTAALLQLDQVQLVPQRLQEYEPDHGSFDIVLLHRSINHLDEDACKRLHRDQDAQNVYRSLFGKLAASATPGAKLIAVDCSRRNLFGDLGLTNPFAPVIEWEKHQPPQLWARLLDEAGFRNPKIRWLSFNTLGSLGRLVLGNRLASYCLTSTFCLTMGRK
jgi:SAM-dependent methyltransferase